MIADRETLENLGFEPASVRRRLAAYLLDVAAVTVHSLLMSGMTSEFEKVSGVRALGLGAAVVIWTLVFFGIWLVLAGRGQSTGKWIMGLQVVGTDGATIGVVRMLLRSTVKALASILLVLDPILVLSDERRRRTVADRILRSQVVDAA